MCICAEKNAQERKLHSHIYITKEPIAMYGSYHRLKEKEETPQLSTPTFQDNQ